MNKLATLIGALIASVPLGALRAFTVVKLWGWFVTPSMGVAAPSLIHAWGMVYLVVLFVHTRPNEERGLVDACIYSSVNSLLTLAFGFALVQFT